MNILNLIPGILKTIGNITGIKIFGDASNALIGAQLSPEQQAQLETALQAHEAEMAQINLDSFKTAMSEALAEVQSTDKYVSRARPTGLYIFYLVSGAIAVGMLFGVKLDPTAVLTILGPWAGVGGTYVYQRTQEKVAALRNGNGS